MKFSLDSLTLEKRNGDRRKVSDNHLLGTICQEKTINPLPAKAFHNIPNDNRK